MALPIIGAIAKLAETASATNPLAALQDKIRPDMPNGSTSPLSEAPRLKGDFICPDRQEGSDILRHGDIQIFNSKAELSDPALHTRVEAAAHSACKFFNLPDITVQEGDSICVYRGNDIFVDKDVFEYNLHQFKQMGCASFEDMTKIWSHECGHRLLRMDFPHPWAQELGADFFAGVRSEMLGLPKGNFEKC